jgi:antirestriction protein ArdC
MSRLRTSGHVEVQGKLRHAEYINNSLELLRDDDKAVLIAASKASQAADYLRSFSEEMAEAA